MLISSPAAISTTKRCPVCGTVLNIEPAGAAGDSPCSHCGHLLWFTLEDCGDTQVVKPTGKLFRPESLDGLFEFVEMRSGMRVVLDFTDVEFLSSAVLGKLISIKKKVAAMQGKVAIRNVHPDLIQVFRITHLDQVFDIES
jgi:anti-anti-sigma factor